MELALVLPFVIALLMAIVAVGLVVPDQLAVWHAAAAAARSASIYPDEPHKAQLAAEEEISIRPLVVDVLRDDYMITGNILGWKGHGIEIGKGKYYNSAWGNTQVIELDGYKNYKITQYFGFDDKLRQNNQGMDFLLTYAYAARRSSVSPYTSGMIVRFNG